MFNILLTIFVWAAVGLFVARLVSAHVCAHYAIAGSTYELRTNLFNQGLMLLLKMSLCLANVVKPAVILL